MRKQSQPLCDFIATSVGHTRNDQVWKLWLDLKAQGWRDLVVLIRSDVRQEFKMRAIAVLLVPHWSYLPFEWRDEDKSTIQNLLFLRGNDDLFKVSELSEGLRNFMMELVYRGAKEVLMLQKMLKHNVKILLSLFYYNCYILDFLKVLPENDPMAEKLFSVYQLNDSVVFVNMEDASGYNPLYTILNDDIPEKWKRLAIAKMHEIITAEESGRQKPRAEHEEALRCYMSQVMLPLAGGNGQIRYSVELFAAQLEFILGLPTIRDRGLFQSYNVERILLIIAEDRYKNLRHRLARHVVLENKREFTEFNIYDGSTKRAAEAMLAEFRTDTELVFALRPLLDKAEERFRKEDNHRSRQKAKTQDVLSQMT